MTVTNLKDTEVGVASTGIYPINRELLKVFLKQKNFNLKTLAPVLGIHESSLFTKLKGTTEFRPSEIEKAANILGLSPQDIMYIFFPRLLGVPADLDPVRYFTKVNGND